MVLKQRAEQHQAYFPSAYSAWHWKRWALNKSRIVVFPRPRNCSTACMDPTVNLASYVEQLKMHLGLRSLLQYSTMWYGTLWYGTVQYSTIQYSAACHCWPKIYFHKACGQSGIILVGTNVYQYNLKKKLLSSKYFEIVTIIKKKIK